MSVIIRLQNLPWSATAHDIRQYFHGLSIPEGGVHIVGGEKGDAFIAFSTDEDARQAFNRSNGKIKDAPITLLLSSRSEMQKVIEAARNQSMAAFLGASQQQSQPSIVPIMPTAVPSTASSLTDFKSNKTDQRDHRRRSRSRSRSRSNERFNRRDRQRDRSRSDSRDRTRDRRRSRTRSRSRERSKSIERRNSVQGGRGNATQPHRVGVWEAPPPTVFANAADSANLLATFVANNILPNILNGNGNVNQLAALAAAGVNLQEQFQLQGNNAPLRPLVQPGLPQQNAPIVPTLNQGNRHEINANGRNKNNFEQRDNGNNNANVPNHCIKLFPFFGGVADITRFFGHLEIVKDGVRFSNDVFGNRNGQIFVNFAYARGKDEALGRSGDRIRNQIVAIEHVGDDEFVNMYLNPKNVQIPKEPNCDVNMRLNEIVFAHLKLDALPNFIKSQDIRKIFHKYALLAVVIEPKGRVSSAYIKFNNPQVAQSAFTDNSTHQFEGKPINVFICSDGEFEDAARKHGTDTVQVPTNVFSMSCLPPKCCDRDIIDFFSDIGIMPAKINMVPNDSGFIDEAICEFYSVDDAILGFQKNGTLFGNNTVCMKYEPVNEAPKKSHPSGAPPLMAQQFSRAMPSPGMNMNHPQGNHSNRPFFQNPNQFNGPPMRGPRPPPHHMPMQMNEIGRGMPLMRRFPHPHHYQQQQHHHHQQPHHPQLQQLDYDDNICDDDEAIAPPGCVLLMENVPYKAGVDEILNFLGSYNVSGENVLRKYNANGLPSGEAKIIFNSPEEVYHVIQQARGRRIRERLIHMAQI